MNRLVDSPCEACRADAPRVSEREAQQLMPQIADWQIVYEADEARLQRTFSFRNFAEALAFTNRIGAMAETLDHHPDLLTRWGAVMVVWYTHKINGLHRNDFICAARTDQLYEQQ